jgi:predicted amidohydrolase YtcJ
MIGRATVLALALAALPAIAQQPRADLIVTNARIYTVDENRPIVEAFAVSQGKVQFAGSAREAMALRGPQTRLLDLHGATVIPGMVDAHAHFLGLGLALQNVDLNDALSYDEVIARVAERAKRAPVGAWIVGRGWDQNRWANTRFPTQDALTRAVPDHPVWLTRVDGHAGLANAAALKVAGVTAATKDVTGGRIERDASGNPTGVFVDNAQQIVDKVVPPPSREQERQALVDAAKEANRWGLVGLHDAGEGRATIDLVEELARGGELSLRVYMMISDDSAAIAHYFARGPQSALYDGHLWIRTVKLYADGALGSRGAALLEPYSDDPGNIGLLRTPPEHLRDVATGALRAGFQVATHAIGDRGNRVALDAYQAALTAVPTADHRFRIEHVQILHHDDVPRFAQMGVIPSMQAVHATSDMYWAGTRIGPVRLLGAYAWRSLLNTGVIIPNGSDFPVEKVNPLLSFHAAVTRQDARDWPPGGWLPEQRMTREEALKAMTVWPAYAAFQETLMGSITPGKYADFVVLDRDIMTVADRDLLGTQVLTTYIGGKAVYDRTR